MKDRGQDLTSATPRTPLAAIVLRTSAALVLAVLPASCRYANPAETVANDTSRVDAVMSRVDNPASEPIVHEDVIQPVTLKTLRLGNQPEYWDVTLDEVLGISMQN